MRADVRRLGLVLAAVAALLVAGCGSARPPTSPPTIHRGNFVHGRVGGPPPGAPAAGDILFVGNGHWSGTPTGFAYAWKDCDSGGANCTTAAGSPTNTTRYQIVSGDVGSTIRVAVTASYSGHPDSTVLSAPTAVVAADVTGFSDTFAGSSIATGPNQWVVVDNTIGNTNTFQCDEATNASETGGHLVETLTHGAVTCPGPSGGNGAITSGCPSACSTTGTGVEVHPRDQAFKYGTETVTAKLTGNNGNEWPAIWLLGDFCQHPVFDVAGADPAPCSWPNVGSEEIDIEDLATANYSHLRSGTVTVANNPVCTSTPSMSDMSANFHTYQMVWTSSSITMKVDGSTFCTFSSDIPTSLEFPIFSAQMKNGTTVPSQATNLISNLTITPAGPDISSSANWPSISGSTVHGSTLTASNGTWTGSPSGFAYQWLQCNGSGNVCSPITTGSCSSTWAACGSTYTTVSGDIGHQIQVLVTASNASGATQYGSLTTGAVS